MFYLALSLVLFSACSGGKENANNERQVGDTIKEVISDIVYTQYPFAYLSDGELYFYSFEENKKVKFVEETEAILNFTFDAEGKTLYYSVERNSTLWLKSADISKSEIKSEWLISWNLNKDIDMGYMYVGMSPLYHHEGKIIIMHGYLDYSPYYDKMTYYYIDQRKTSQLANDIDLRRSSYGVLSRKEKSRYFEVIDEQLYYIHNHAKVCLTDKIDFKAVEEKNKHDSEICDSRQYSHYIFSPDKKKVAFAAEMLMGEWANGPYCIANVDGSKQMLLEESNFMVVSNPIWLNAHELIFRSHKGELYVANNDENSIKKIAENVSFYETR